MSDFGFVRVAVATPRVRLADPDFNAQQITTLALQAHSQWAQVLLTPELSLTGYSIGDLLHQPALLAGALRALKKLLQHTENLHLCIVVGMPLAIENQLFNVAAVCGAGKIFGIVPKTYIPNYKEFEEARWFAPSSHLQSRELKLFGQEVPVGTDLLFLLETKNEHRAVLGVEICEDLFMPIQPSAQAALAGATILLNLSASPELVAKARYRRELVSNISGRAIAAYAYAGAAVTESTRDVVFSGHSLIAENGTVLAESPWRFVREPRLLMADVDAQRLVRERMHTGTFGVCAKKHSTPYRRVTVPVQPTNIHSTGILHRTIARNPFVPTNTNLLAKNCEEIFTITAQALATRLEHIGGSIRNTVSIGISGGLDSTLALLITVRAYDILRWNRGGVHALTMPGFGTTERTRGNAHALCSVLSVPIKECSIVQAAEAVLRAGEHEPCRKCLMCENAQARVRTNILMNQGFAIGTGDLSEIALGWCTYGGDQLSMYHCLAGIPKTLVKFVIKTAAELELFGSQAKTVLLDILNTPISPELLPPDAHGQIAQKTEDVVGPYELHDFFLFHMLRNGYGPRKILFLACRAFADAYDEITIKKWLSVFYRRFFRNQFKRNAAPDGPKVGSVSLSQRGDWRMPSDAQAALWLTELKN